MHRPYLLDAQRCSHLFIVIFEAFADFVSHDFADTFEVAAKTHAVLLDDGIAEFSHVLVEDAIRSFKVVNLNHSVGGICHKNRQKKPNLYKTSIIFSKKLHASQIISTFALLI